MSREEARRWIRRYLHEAQRHPDGLEAALPLTRDQVLLEDPESASQLAIHPRWLISANPYGGVTVVWMDVEEEEAWELED